MTAADGVSVLMPVEPVVAQGWSYRHPGRSGWAIQDANFQLRPGSLTLVLGASGSGKSTLLRGMAGALGQGQSVGRLAVPGPIGYVGQDPADNIVMERVGDDVAFPLENRAVAPELMWPRVGEVLDEVGLGGLAGRITLELSGGQTQLLALAAAIAARPGLLLLDEPTANLDPDAAARVVAAVLAVQAASGCSVVVVEHRVGPWLARADHALLVHPHRGSGAQVELLSPHEVPDLLAQQPDLAGQVWLGPVTGIDLRPPKPAGPVVLRAQGAAVAGRLGQPVDLELRCGEVLALLGAPGSGKSTLLNVLSGLAAPDSGRVVVSASGRERVDPWRWRSAEVAGTFGVVFQDPADQFLTSRVDDELGHGLAVAGVDAAQAKQQVVALAGQLGLAELLPVSPFSLSGGQARRLSVGTALIGHPPILVLDEPTFGQDPRSWGAIVEIIAAHRDRGGAVLLATHDPELVRVLGARELHLKAAAAGGRRGGPVRLGAAPGAAPGALRRLNPLVLLASAALVSAAALASTSTLTNVALVCAALAAGLLGGAPRKRLAVLLAPALLAGASAALSNSMLAPGGLSELANWQAAALPASRIMAVAVPGLLAALSIDPTALADALTQQLRVPPRVAYSVLAGLRLIPLLGHQWQVLRLANRARGLAGSGLVSRAREFTSLVFRLLIGALRRGSGLALALDARGLGAGPRTVARPQRFSWPDGVALLITTAVVGWAWSMGL